MQKFDCLNLKKAMVGRTSYTSQSSSLLFLEARITSTSLTLIRDFFDYFGWGNTSYFIG